MDSEPATPFNPPQVHPPPQGVLDLVRYAANSNDTLDTVDRALITSSRESLRSQINAIIAIIPQLNLKSEEEECLNAVSQLRRWEEECTLALSLMRDFPPEILRQIFSEYAAMNEYTSVTGEGGCWALGRVCKKWRAIAIDHREIWSNICVSLQEINTAVSARPGSSSPVLWLRKMMQRAGNRPLQMMLSHSPRGTASVQTVGAQLIFSERRSSSVKREEVAAMAVALMTSARWESLVIAEECTLDLPIPLSSVTYDSLRSLEIRRSEGTQVEWMRGVPNLEEFKVVDLTTPLCAHALKCLPSSVRKIDVNLTVPAAHPRYSIPLEPFADTPFVNLTMLTLTSNSAINTSAHVYGGRLPTYQRRCMPSLRTLHLHNVIDPMRFLSCPAIEEADVLLNVSTYKLFLEPDGWLERILEGFRDRADGVFTPQMCRVAFPPNFAWRDVRLT